MPATQPAAWKPAQNRPMANGHGVHCALYSPVPPSLSFAAADFIAASRPQLYAPGLISTRPTERDEKFLFAGEALRASGILNGQLTETGPAKAWSCLNPFHRKLVLFVRVIWKNAVIRSVNGKRLSDQRAAQCEGDYSL